MNFLKYIFFNLTIFIVLLIFIELFSFTFIKFKNIFYPGATSKHKIPEKFNIDSFKNNNDYVLEHLNVHLKELSFDNELTVGSPNKIFTRTIKVIDDYRNSYEKLSNDSINIYCFGGSTMWGSGVRDIHTIPGYLNSISDKDKYQFINYGIPAFNSSQELLKLTKLLSDGKIIHKVILYNGANDITASLLKSVKRNQNETLSILKKFYETTSTHKIQYSLFSRINNLINISTTDEYILTDIDKKLIDDSLENYFKNIKFILQLGNYFSFEVYVFLQPFLLNGLDFEAKNLNDFELYIYNGHDKKTKAVTKVYYEKYKKKMKDIPQIIDLSDIFIKNNQKGNYFDVVHVGPLSNKLIAEEIYKYIK